MKFMKLGTKPDTFFTEAATRTLVSELPSDLTIRINKTIYRLHKLQFSLLSKCGRLRYLCSDSGDSTSITAQLHDIPGGEDAFELCAKFCYGITISISAHNFVSAFCAAKFLQMTESVERGNFIIKLETFFDSCILEGWKDLIVTLETTGRLSELSENLGIFQRCINSITEKILLPSAKVTWSYTYTRSGYDKKRHQSVPKDWWTEDISDLDIDIFRCLITTVRSTNKLSSQLIGEALHVYACRWLPKIRVPEHSSSLTREFTRKNLRILVNIVSMIPDEPGSVSFGFLLRLLGTANFFGASPATKSELVRRSGQQLEEATVNDLLLPLLSPSNQNIYDVDLIRAMLESFLVLWKQQSSVKNNERCLRSIRKVGRLIDSYLQEAARDASMAASKMVSLAEALPEIARPSHDGLYRAINTYLKEHPDVTKSEKKRLCQMLDCQKLSPEVCAHVVKNERLPLRTVVQVLFFEQERGSGSRHTSRILSSPQPFTREQLVVPPVEDDRGNNLVELQQSSNSVGGGSATQDRRTRSVQQLKLEELAQRRIGELEIGERRGLRDPSLDSKKAMRGSIHSRRTSKDR